MVIGELRPGMAIIYNDQLYLLINCEHTKIARGPAFCRARLRNLKTDQVLERTLRDSDNVEPAFIEKRKLQYQYHQDDQYHFMDLETYEDLLLHKSRIADKSFWLVDNLELVGLFYDNKLIDLEFPPSLIFKVTETDPGFRGDTVKQGTKPATLETGLVINVPNFINSGENIRVNTKTKDYLGRA